MSLMTISELNVLTALRKILHQNAELAEREKNTLKIIKNFISHYNPNKALLRLGGNGAAFIYDGGIGGKTIVVRADMDAVPVEEINEFEYKSLCKGVSHKCGHDGHMAIVAGLAILLNRKKDFKGKVVLLFQPAEETGEGANQILLDERFTCLHPDYVLGLHNLPGYERGEVIHRRGHFAATSKGMIIRLFGKTSHAAEPENGISPALAMSEVITMLDGIIKEVKEKLNDFALITTIHARLGEVAFGTTPGYAEIMATLRSYRNEDMNLVTSEASDRIAVIADKYNLKYEIGWTEEFPATINSDECYDALLNVIAQGGMNHLEINTPFKWSEDFGHFTNKYNGLFFGIGTGKNTPQLHNPDYDFPDEIIDTGVSVFYSLIKELNG